MTFFSCDGQRVERVDRLSNRRDPDPEERVRLQPAPCPDERRHVSTDRLHLKRSGRRQEEPSRDDGEGKYLFIDHLLKFWFRLKYKV